MRYLYLLPWAIAGGGEPPPPDPTDPGAHRPPPNREWGWFLLAAACVGVLVYAVIWSQLHP